MRIGALRFQTAIHLIGTGQKRGSYLQNAILREKFEYPGRDLFWRFSRQPVAICGIMPDFPGPESLRKCSRYIRIAITPEDAGGHLGGDLQKLVLPAFIIFGFSG